MRHMHPEHHDRPEDNPPLDGYTTQLLAELAQPLAAPAKPEKCRDAKGHYAKCSPAKATTVAKTPPAAKAPTK